MAERPVQGFFPRTPAWQLPCDWLSCTELLFLDPPALQQAKLGPSWWQAGVLQAHQGAEAAQALGAAWVGAYPTGLLIHKIISSCE